MKKWVVAVISLGLAGIPPAFGQEGDPAAAGKAMQQFLNLMKDDDKKGKQGGKAAPSKSGKHDKKDKKKH